MKLKKSILKSNFDKQQVIIRNIISILIPLFILGYIVYMNWLPFGYEKTFVLDVGSDGDMDSSEKLYLAESSDLSAPKTYENKTFRTLTGTTELIFNPRAVLTNAILNVSVKGKNVFIVPPKIDFNSSDYDWNLSIDFSEGIPEFLEVNTNFSSIYQQLYNQYLHIERNISIDFSEGIPAFLEGNAIIKDNCTYFNGSARLTYPETEDDFEEGPFAIYVEWTPEDNNSNFQQIVGHYNWEIIQNSQSVSFQVGRMNNENGTLYSISSPLDNGFFNKKHSVLALYLPDEDGRGLISLYVDNIFIGEKIINSDIIWRDYSNNDLSLGKSKHGTSNYFQGCVHKIELINKNLSSFYTKKTQSELVSNNLVHPNKDCAYFDGQTSLHYPDTGNQFEKGSFAVYVEWTPENNISDFQQIVGHYNWEVLQESKRVVFMVGRMNNATGNMYSLGYPIDDDFFDKKHSALAIYNLPHMAIKDNVTTENYIELFVDNNFAGRTYIGNATIWDKYNNHSLTFGKSYHGIATHYVGCIHKFGFINEAINLLTNSISFSSNIPNTKIYLTGNGDIDSIKLYARKQDGS